MNPVVSLVFTVVCVTVAVVSTYHLVRRRHQKARPQKLKEMKEL